MAISSKKNNPLLFLFSEFLGDITNGFLDPVQKTLKLVDLPELGCQIQCVASGYGWLLLLSRQTKSLFFFNPINQDRINLPYRSCVFNAAAFSAPPRSSSCSVFAVERDSFSGNLNIDVFNPHSQGKHWNRHAFRISSSVFGSVMKVVCCKSVLYCVDLKGRVSTFETSKGSWKVLAMGDKKSSKHIGGSILVEFKGDVFAIEKNKGKVHKLKLDDGFADWQAQEDLGDVTIFIGPHGGCAASSLGKEFHKKFIAATDEPHSKGVAVYDINGTHCKKTINSTRFSWLLHAPIWIN